MYHLLRIAFYVKFVNQQQLLFPLVQLIFHVPDNIQHLNI